MLPNLSILDRKCRGLLLPRDPQRRSVRRVAEGRLAAAYCPAALTRLRQRGFDVGLRDTDGRKAYYLAASPWSRLTEFTTASTDYQRRRLAEELQLLPRVATRELKEQWYRMRGDLAVSLYRSRIRLNS
jgi:hypothetical protein